MVSSINIVGDNDVNDDDDGDSGGYGGRGGGVTDLVWWSFVSGPVVSGLMSTSSVTTCTALP